MNRQSGLRIIVGFPSRPLQDVIDICWSIPASGNDRVSRHEIFPDCSAKLIFRYSSSRKNRMVLIGPLSERTTVEIDESADYYGIRFHPGRLPKLMQTGMAELTDSHVEITEINGRDIEDLGREMAAASSHEERQRIMESTVRGLPLLHGDSYVESALELITRRYGKSRIGEIARLSGARRRLLERRFISEIGLSPKRLSRMIRLRKLLSILHSRRYRSLSDLAAGCGFSDQSHMIRDFKALTGRLPGDKTLFEPTPLPGKVRTRIHFRYRP